MDEARTGPCPFSPFSSLLSDRKPTWEEKRSWLTLISVHLYSCSSETLHPARLLDPVGRSLLGQVPAAVAHLDVQVRSRINQHLDHGFVPGGTGVHQWRQTLRASKADAKPPGNGRSCVLHGPPSQKPQSVCLTRLLVLSSPASWLDLLPLPGPLDTHPVRHGSRAQAPKPDLDTEATSAMGSCKPCPGHSSLSVPQFPL